MTDTAEKLDSIFDEAADNMRYEWGIEKFEELVAENPGLKTPKNLTRLGMLYDHLALDEDRDDGEELEEKAFDLYDEALDKDPDYASAVWGKGRIYWHRGSEEALPYAKKAVEMAREAGEGEAGMVGNVALVHWELGNYEKAEEWFFKAIDKSPERWGFYFNLLKFYEETDQLTQEKLDKYLPKFKELLEKDDKDRGKWGNQIQEFIEKLESLEESSR